jgi:hypothetical protein
MFHVIFTVNFCTIDQLTPTNAPKQVLSLIPLLKVYPNTHFDTSTLPSSGGSLKFVHRPMFFVTSEQLCQYSLLPLCIKLYNSSIVKLLKLIVNQCGILY